VKHTLLAVAIFLALVSTASGAPTKAAYIKKADQLCKAANTAIAPISAKLNQLNLNNASGITQAVKLFHAALSIEGVAYDKLIALPKPPADKTVLTHIWETLDVEVSNIGKLIDALNDLNATAISKDESAISLAKASYKGLAQGFGFHYCGTH
jgi:hypothetical protein